MAPTDPTHFPKTQPSHGEEPNEDLTLLEAKLNQDCKELIHSLPRAKGWRTPYLYLFQGFWCQPSEIQAISTFQKHFQARDTDIIVATVPKSGTTWMKALTFAIANRHKFPYLENHPLLTSNPHELVPFFEYTTYANTIIIPDLSNMNEPRIFGTHVPFASLANSIKETNCKIIYICRNPFDTFVSSWIFLNKIKPGSCHTLSLEEAFDMYCKGMIGYGPFWNHILGYWNESKERSEKVLFLKYEDLIEDCSFHVKRVAEFLGYPFTLEEKNNGVVENIIKLCSFENMKDLEVNKSGTFGRDFEKKYLFRNGIIGDWVNYLSPSMVEKLSKVMEEKLGGSDISFRMWS